MTFQYTLTLSDSTGVFSSEQAAAILANARGAMDIYSRHIEGQGVMNVLISADLSGRTVGSGRSLVAVNKSIENGKQVIHEGAVAELITGVDPNGDGFDIEVTLPLAYLTNSLSLDPDPVNRGTPAATWPRASSRATSSRPTTLWFRPRTASRSSPGPTPWRCTAGRCRSRRT